VRSVQASVLPMSIIIVGIGDADFNGLLYLIISLLYFTILFFANNFLCFTVGDIF